MRSTPSPAPPSVRSDDARTIRIRWALAGLVILGLVPLLAFAIGVVRLFVQHERAAAEQRFRETARALALAVDRELVASITAMQALATSRHLDMGDLRAFYDDAARVLASRPQWAAVNLVDPGGRHLLNSRRPFGVALPPIAETESFREVVRTREPAVGNFTRSALGDETVLPLRVPVIRAGRLRYVLGAGLRPAALNRLFADQRVPEDWTGAILDRRQIIIGRSRSPERFIGQPATEKLAAATAAAAEGTFWDVTKEGRAAFGAFGRSETSGWSVVLGVPAEQVYATVYWPLGLLIAGGFVLLVLGLAVAVLIGRRLEASVAELSSEMRELGQGRSPARRSRLMVRELQALGDDIQAAGLMLGERDAQRAEAEAKLRTQTQTLEVINRTGRLVSAELDQQKVVQAVTDAATQLSGAAFGAFFYNVVDASGERYMLYTVSGVPRERFSEFPMPRNTELFATTFRGEAIIRSDDITRDHRYGHNPPHHGMPAGHLPVRSYLAVPVVSRSGEVIGGLFLGHPEAAVFHEDAERVVVGIAAQAAIAMDNARLYERQERARAEAEEANRSKDEFLAMLSHELRTPLNAILGWVRMLRSGQIEPSQRPHALEVVERNARSQAQLIEDLLDVSRIISGNLRLDVRPLSLQRVVENVVETIRPAADAKQIRVQPVLDPSAGPVSGDPDRLQQVMWNLLSNAVRFTPKGGRIHVRLERVNSHVEMIVSDSGEGIAPEVLPFVFDRFRQADSTTTRRHGGLGLGLALVKHLVEAHGGSVHAYSPGPGQGATFTVKLPLLVHPQLAEAGGRRHPTAYRDGPPVDPPVLTGKRVLVVDDDGDARDLFSTMLRGAGADVRTVESAAEALGVVGEWLPDVLLSDIEMPEEDGYALIRRLRAGPAAWARVPAVAVTAYGSVDDRVRALRGGFDAHLAKPVDPAELLAVLAALAARGGPAPAPEPQGDPR